MKSRPLLLFFFPTLLLVFTMVQVRAQQDTSSALPLGLWGIWVDNAQPPLNGGYTDWSQEVGNFSSVGGNYLVGCIPRWTEDSLMLLVEPLGYKVDINRSFGIPDTSLRDWIFNTTHDYVDDITWRAAAGRKVRGIYNTFVTGPGGGRPGFYTYLLGHETDFTNTYHWDIRWSRFGWVIDSIKQIDPTHKSLAVMSGSAGTNPFPNNQSVRQFAQRFPNLGIYMMDAYPFYNWVTKHWLGQQPMLDWLLLSYNDCMVAFRDKNTEWHAVIQAHRDYITGPYRRPLYTEMRVQAYLALSRGARGISSYVYGSIFTSGSHNPTSGTPESGSIITPTTVLMGAADGSHFDGIVTTNRLPFTFIFDGDNISAFDSVIALHDELRPLGPTIRKIRVYDSFANSSIPSNNIAGIESVTGSKIEIGVFKRVDQGADSTVHFMLVNRVCNDSSGNPTSARPVTAVLKQGKFKLQNKRDNTWVYGSYNTGTNKTTLTLTLGSGKGELYLRAKSPAIVQSVTCTGSVGQHPTISWAANTEPDLAGYKLYRKVFPNEHTYALIATLSTSQRSYTDPECTVRSGRTGGTWAQYYVKAYDTQSVLSDSSNVVSAAVNYNPRKEIVADGKPEAFTLSECYPNPFNPSTEFRYALPVPSEISLIVFDNLGREVASLVKGYYDTGYYSVRWDATSHASGVYFAHFVVKDPLGNVTFRKVNRLMLIK